MSQIMCFNLVYFAFDMSFDFPFSQFNWDCYVEGIEIVVIKKYIKVVSGQMHMIILSHW